MTDSLATGATGEESLAAEATVAATPAPTAQRGAETTAELPAGGKWPDNWRELLAGEDKKALEGLGRYASPSDIWKAQQEAARKISEGLKPVQKPGDKATDDDWKKFRESAGIPEKVDDYVKAIQLPDKRQIGEDDLPIVNAFAERAIKKGVSPSDMAVMVDSYYALQEEQANQLAEKDAKYKRESEQVLKEEYGGDLKPNMAAMRPYFESFDQQLFDNLMGGRLADGTKIGNNPNLIRFFVAKALDENPAATVVPGGNTSLESIDTEIKALEKRMGEDRQAWFKDESAQKRYQQLVEARDKLAAR